MPNCSVGPSEWEIKFSLQEIWYGLRKNAWFPWQPLIWFSRLGGRPTNSIISRVLLILEHKNWCQIKAYTHVFLPVVRFVNHLICIFMNINENLQKWSKIIKKHKWTYFSTKTSSNHHCCQFLYPQWFNLISSFIQWSYMKIMSWSYMKIISFAYSWLLMKS